MNQVHLFGRLGKDPDIFTTQELKKIATINIATNEQRKNESGGYDKITTWHKVKFFGKLAELVEKYVKKGDRLLITGKISNGNYEKDGKQVWYSEIIANSMEFIEGNQNNNQQEPETKIVEGDDDLPF